MDRAFHKSVTQQAGRSAVRRAFVFCVGLLFSGLGMAFASGLGLAFAKAAPLPGSAQPVGYQVVDQEVGDVVTGIAGQLALRADISSKVRGRVHGRITATTAEHTLDELGSLYGFDWYCDGQTIYVSSYAEATRKVLPLGQVSGDELLHAIDALGVSDPRWPVRMSDSRDIAFVNGPPHYVALVEETLSALAQRAHAGVTEVHVFRGGS